MTDYRLTMTSLDHYSIYIRAGTRDPKPGSTRVVGRHGSTRVTIFWPLIQPFDPGHGQAFDPGWRPDPGRPANDNRLISSPLNGQFSADFVEL